VDPQGRSGHVRKNLAPTGIRSPDRPARSKSLYRLRYPANHDIERLGVNVCAHCAVACVIISGFCTEALEPLHSSQRQFPSWKGIRMSLKNLRAQVVATAPLMSSFFSLTATQDSRLLERLGKQSNEYKGGSKLKTYPGSGVSVFFGPWGQQSQRTPLLTHCGRVTQICVLTLQLCRTSDADLRF